MVENQQSVDELNLFVYYQDEWVSRVAELVIDIAKRHTHARAPEHFTADLASFLLDETLDKRIVHGLRVRSVDRDVTGRTEHTLESYVDIVYDHLCRSLTIEAAKRCADLAWA